MAGIEYLHEGQLFYVLNRKGSNTSYKCSICQLQFTCSGLGKLTNHILGTKVLQLNPKDGDRVKACVKPAPAAYLALKTNRLKTNIEIEGQRKRARLSEDPQVPVSGTVPAGFKAQTNETADLKIMSFLVQNNIAPNVVESTSFKEMLAAFKNVDSK